jgi:hypothetical protein
LLSPRSLAGKPDMQAVAAKPQEDGLGCHHLSCKSSAFGHKVINSLLVEKPLTTGGLLAFVGGSLVEESLATIGLLAFIGSALVEEALAMSCLLLFASSLLVNMALAGCRLEAVALILPQGIDRPLPILVGAFRAGASLEKDGPPGNFGGSRPAACWSSCRARPIQFSGVSQTQLGTRGGGCDHLYCSHAEGSQREDEDK